MLRKVTRETGGMDVKEADDPCQSVRVVLEILLFNLAKGRRRVNITVFDKAFKQDAIEISAISGDHN